MSPDSKKWPADRAILLVHGVGNAKPGDYAELVADVQALLGDDAKNVVIYQLFYDFINNWFKDKIEFAEKLRQAKALFKATINDDDDDLEEAIADYSGDVLWPVLSRSARAAVREAYVKQLKQIVADGTETGVPARKQKITIIAHSLGCFYTYEALHTAASKAVHGLQPFPHGVTYSNVVLMAPPIQLIRTMGDVLGPVVPHKNELSTFAGTGLSLPSVVLDDTQETFPSARNWVSVTGELDPIGGYFFRKRAKWGFTTIDGLTSIVDDQKLLTNIQSKSDLVTVLRRALSEKAPPKITIDNPHSWSGYVTRHKEELRQWLTA
jgi:hypothetical protein